MVHTYKPPNSNACRISSKFSFHKCQCWECFFIFCKSHTLNYSQFCHLHEFTMHFTQHSPNFEWEKDVPINVGWMLNGMYNEMGTCFVVVWEHNNALEDNFFQSLDKEFKSMGSPIVHYTLNLLWTWKNNIIGPKFSHQQLWGSMFGLIQVLGLTIKPFELK